MHVAMIPFSPLIIPSLTIHALDELASSILLQYFLFVFLSFWFFPRLSFSSRSLSLSLSLSLSRSLTLTLLVVALVVSGV